MRPVGFAAGFVDSEGLSVEFATSELWGGDGWAFPGADEGMYDNGGGGDDDGDGDDDDDDEDEDE